MYFSAHLSDSQQKWHPYRQEFYALLCCGREVVKHFTPARTKLLLRTPDKTGREPLHIAAYKDGAEQEKIVELLLTRQRELHERAEEGWREQLGRAIGVVLRGGRDGVEDGVAGGGLPQPSRRLEPALSGYTGSH